MKARDPFFAQALAARAEARDAFEDHRLAEYAKAEEATRGALLNRRGFDVGVDSLSLFMGNETRAHAYASPELIEWWSLNGRPTFERFAGQWIPPCAER